MTHVRLRVRQPPAVMTLYQNGPRLTHPSGRPKLRMNIREVIELLKGDGWHLARTRGSHRQFKHPTKPGLVTVAGHAGDDLAPGTLRSILRQAGINP